MVSARDQEGLPGKRSARLGQTPPEPFPGTAALIIYPKNIICLKGQEGIYGLEIAVLWSWKESQRFYGSVVFLKKCLRQTILKKHQHTTLVPNPSRVITQAAVTEAAAAGFSQMSRSSPGAQSSLKYLLVTKCTAGPVLRAESSCGQNSFCPWGLLVLNLGCTFKSPREL